ncbi:MAG: hypothetical protein II281_06265, partial [Alistipes sp.]|nr:hypothetical protein [Alistipes sp.]
EELTLWVSANDGAWEQVTIPTYSDNKSWTFVESGEISLAKYVGSTVKVAFKYVSTASNAGTWEVKNFSVAEASGAVTPDPTPDPEPEPTPTPDGKYVTMSLSTIDTTSWTVNNYGSQNVTDLSTYLTWDINGFGFTACKWCLPNTTTDYNGIAFQAQGNATSAAKQSRIGNTTSFGKIKRITVVSYNTKYTPNFNLAIGATQVVGVDVPANMIAAESMTQTQTTVGNVTKYTNVYEPTEDAGFFAIYKNTDGALYIGEITVEYE